MEISNENNGSAVQSYVDRKDIDDLVNSKQSCTDCERYNLVQTVDLGDLTLSSFNDFLRDCSYCEDSSLNNLNGNADGGIPISFHSSNTKQLFSDSINASVQDNCTNKNDSKLDDLLNSKNNNIEQKLDGLINRDNYNFYHVFEVIQNPVTCNRDKDPQNQSTKTGSVKCKSHKVSGQKKKKKRKVITGAIRKGQRYLPNFKRKVLDYASSHTFKATALRFNINCNTITEWARESKRLSLQQKSTTSMPANISNICHYKTEIVHTPTTKTDIILLNDTFTIETELKDNVLRTIEGDVTPGEGARCDDRFLDWIKRKRHEGKELTREEVYGAANGFAVAADIPAWFDLWLKRYHKALHNSEKSDNETEKYIMYPTNFKLEVVLYARSFTKNSAARVFNVPRRRIFDWFKSSDDGTSESHDIENPAAAANREGKKGKCRKDLYAELHEWYKKRFSDGSSPSSNEIKSKARELFAANGIGSLKFSEGWLHKFCKRLNIKLRHTEDDRLLIWILSQFDKNVSLSHQEITEKSTKLIGKRKDFKGSKGWTLRFLKRHRNFLQQVPTIQDKLPEIVHSHINEFCRSFKDAVRSREIAIGSVGCMDEVPITIDYPQDGKATNVPLLRKTGFENCQAVAFLCMLADGRVLPPAVVLRGTGERQVLSNDEGIDVLVLYQKDGIVDVHVVAAWIEEVWLRFVPSPSALIVDSFEAHSTTELRERLDRANCFLAIIPEGCSSQLQPLDVEITPKFRDLIKNEWKELPSNEVAYSSKVGKKCRCPNHDTILTWIRSVYRKIEENPYSIRNSFKLVGLID